ncbi:hypothetical protein CDAR_253251, partial [Caerostris darwini]
MVSPPPSIFRMDLSTLPMGHPLGRSTPPTNRFECSKSPLRSPTDSTTRHFKGADKNPVTLRLVQKSSAIEKPNTPHSRNKNSSQFSELNRVEGRRKSSNDSPPLPSTPKTPFYVSPITLARRHGGMENKLFFFDFCAILNPTGNVCRLTFPGIHLHLDARTLEEGGG